MLRLGSAGSGGVYVPRQAHDGDAAVLVCRHLAGVRERPEERPPAPIAAEVLHPEPLSEDGTLVAVVVAHG